MFLFIFDTKMENFKELGAVVKALKQSKQDTTCYTSVYDTVKLVIYFLGIYIRL